MNRFFSMNRRRPNFVDLTIPRLSGVDGYRVQSSSNFDGSWATLMTAPVQGYVDPAINLASVDIQNLGQGTHGPPVRVIFNPATYSLTDTEDFWLRFVPVTGGSAGTPGAPTLVLPSEANHGLGVVTIRGAAPVGADSTEALQLDLPRLMTDLRFSNEDGSNPLFVSFEQDGAEVRVIANQTQVLAPRGTQGSIWVRSTGDAVNFSATMTLALHR